MGAHLLIAVAIYFWPLLLVSTLLAVLTPIRSAAYPYAAGAFGGVWAATIYVWTVGMIS